MGSGRITSSPGPARHCSAQNRPPWAPGVTTTLSALHGRPVRRWKRAAIASRYLRIANDRGVSGPVSPQRLDGAIDNRPRCCLIGVANRQDDDVVAKVAFVRRLHVNTPGGGALAGDAACERRKPHDGSPVGPVPFDAAD